MKFGATTIFVSFLIIALLYLFFPTNNSVIDAYAYAGQVKYAEELFSPHHLLYNPLNYVLQNLLNWIGIEVDALRFGKILNGLFVIASGWILYKIILQSGQKREAAILYTLIGFFSYATWRFGTENEVYIVPIFFSLLGSYCFLKYIQKCAVKFIWLASFMAAIACLFHQIHFFWWLGLLVGSLWLGDFRKHLLIFFLTGLVVPLVYFVVIVFALHQPLNIENVMQFVLHDFYQGSADAGFDARGLLMTPISFVRSFVQVHPIVLILLEKHWFYWVAAAAVLFMIILLIKDLKRCYILQNKNQNSNFVITHGVIFLLQFAFAIFAKGNAEFMVMLPFLILMIIAQLYIVCNKTLFRIMTILLIWNFSFGIFPNNRFVFYNDNQFVDYLIQNPDEKVVVRNLVTRSKYYYLTGKPTDRFIPFEKVTADSIKTLIENNPKLLTDAIDYPEILNREKLMQSGEDDLFKDEKNKNLVLKYPGLFGETSVYEVRR